MDNDKNVRYVHSQALYPRGFFYTDQGGYNSPEPAHFNAASTAELASPLELPYEGYYSGLEWVPASTESQGTPPMSSSTVAHYEDERAGRPSSVSLIKGLRGMSLDNAAVLVAMLAMCVFIGLAIWAAAAVQGELQDYDIDAVDDADASLHLESRARVPSAQGVSGREIMGAQDWKITVIHRQSLKSKRTSPALDDADMATSREGRPDDNDDVREWPVETDQEYTGEPTAEWTAEVEDTTVARSERRIHRRRRLPRNKAGRRSTRSGSTERLHQRRRRVQQHAVPADDSTED
ncbi:uncharacterized protein LOC144123394 [Amblyomma americanum]